MRITASRCSKASLRKVIHAIASICAALVMCTGAFSQANTGRIQGNVTDQTGGAIVGATILVTNIEQNSTRTLTTDEAGAYNAPALLPGTYKVNVQYQGFRSVERSGIELEVGKEVQVSFALQPGEQTQKITVTEALPMVETTNAVLGGTLQPGTIGDLPLNGRNFMNLLQLRPGVTIYLGGGAWTQSTNGLRPEHNVYILDGITAMEPLGGQSTINSVSLAGDAATLLPIDTIQEFNVQQNPKAEFGWKPGSITNIALKSGTNQLHGTANAFGRTDALDARNPFLTGTNADGSTQKQRIGLEEFGSTLGGPVKKDKTFFYLGYEGQRYHVGNPNVFSYPTPDTFPGVPNPTFSVMDACNAMKAQGLPLSPTSLKMSGLDSNCAKTGGYSIFNLDPSTFSRNDAALAAGLPNISASMDTLYSVDNGLGKVDFHLSDKNTINAKAFIGTHRGLVVNSATIVQPFWRPNDHAYSEFYGGQWNYTPSSSVVNTLRYGFNYFHQAFETADCAGDNAGAPAYGLPFGYGGANGGVKPNCGFTNITINSNSFVATGCCANFPKYYGPDKINEFIENVSILKGKHAYKLGGELRMSVLGNTGTFSAGRGNEQFAASSGAGANTALENFMIGAVNGNSTLFIGEPRRHVSGQAYALFAQDDFRVTPRIVVNYGVRYEYQTPMKELNHLLANFDPNTGLGQLGNQLYSAWNGDKNNFAPRLGLAWDVFGTGKTVVRAGGTMIYVTNSWWDMLFQQNRNNPVTGLNSNPTGFSDCTGAVNTVSASFPANCQAPVGNIVATGVTLTAPAVVGGVPGTPVAGQINWNQNPAVYGGNIFPQQADAAQKPQVFECAIDKQCTIQAVSPNLKNGYVTTWSLGVQQAITNNLSVSVDYVGNHATNLIGMYYTNTPQNGAGYCLNPDGTPFSAALKGQVTALAAVVGGNGCPNITSASVSVKTSAAALELSRPLFAKFPYYSYVYTVGNPFESNYDGAQITLTQRATHGLNYTIGYTFAHALDDVSTDRGGPNGQNPYNLKAEYEASEFDIRQRFTATITYALPSRTGYGHMLEGWKLTSIVNLQSALPWGVSGNRAADPSGIAEFQDRWNFYGDPKDFSNLKSTGIPCFGPQTGCTPTIPNQCVAAAAALGPTGPAALNTWGCYMKGNSFMIPAALGQFGNMSPDLFRGSPFRLWDFSVIKEWKVTERFGAEFRWEIFDLLNTTHYGNPQFNGGGQTSPFNAGPALGSTQSTPDVGNNNPSLGSGGPREMQVGLKLTF